MNMTIEQLIEGLHNIEDSVTGDMIRVEKLLGDRIKHITVETEEELTEYESQIVFKKALKIVQDDMPEYHIRWSCPRQRVISVCKADDVMLTQQAYGG